MAAEVDKMQKVLETVVYRRARSVGKLTVSRPSLIFNWFHEVMQLLFVGTAGLILKYYYRSF
jgi:hypothetical protein